MFTRLRWSAFGLRGRIVGVVLVTTITTLSWPRSALLPRLESSLQTASLRTVKTDLGNGAAKRYLGRLKTVDYALAAEIANGTLQYDLPLEQSCAQGARPASRATSPGSTERRSGPRSSCSTATST